ncbi:hypothetical protein WN51_00586 [Melipona quadrifasciata]|uniref:Uncharacterized protein n=1 Tax=Melipona quadrifasciata TaxID=166423 RepID=A0A0N0U579_9HYME|nr:hypothetical protein WN51_00586 [Melipona quadrifasciata]
MRELEKYTPSYIINKETKNKEAKEKAIIRGIKYEETARKSNKKLVVDCLRELERGRGGSEIGKWKKKRRMILEEIGITLQELKERRENEGNEEQLT